MYQLTYVSVARIGQGWSDVDAILARSRVNNRRDGITGLLAHDGRRYLQVLEGAKADVIATFDRIAADPRHAIQTVLATRVMTGREFAGWDMACQEVSTLEDGRSLAASIDRICARVSDLDLRAAFASFAWPRAVA